ncbi:MAG: peptidase C1 [candidate division KSB1 bacterium]|nr:peptidase C1 [candidate division KSB1 bacterium]
MRRSWLIVLTLALVALAQAQDKAIYKTRKVGEQERTYLTIDAAALKYPRAIEEFQTVWHNPPVRQDTTGTCWAFSTISFLESEIKRLHGKEVRLSEMYVVYWEYVEKARRFLREKGNSEFGEGSEHNAVIERIRQYGCVPLESYTGLVGGRTTHNHAPLYRELRSFLDYCKEKGYWDEDQAIAYVRLVLNKHLGEPPTHIVVDGREMTPIEYARDYLRLPLDDYVAIMSTTSIPFWTQGEYKVPDNWWHSQEYYNVPLEDFYEGIRSALRSGFSVALGGDISEPGKVSEVDLAVVPSFDIPGQLINQDAREFRFYNRTSTDDHGIHCVGYTRKFGHDWFLIKDSGRSAYEGNLKGYYIFRDDYVKLKMLTYLVHKDGVSWLLKKFQEKQAASKQAKP